MEAQYIDTEESRHDVSVVLTGDPLSTYTRVLETWVEGRQVYDASNPEHAKYDVGGWQVYNPSPLQQHDGCLR